MPDSILIFGGGVLQLSIVDRAKKMGYRTIVIDPNPHAIAKESADHFLVVDGNDFEKTKFICLEYNVKGIVTAATDNPILMMSRVAAETGLVFPSYSSCNTLLDKGKFKEFLKKNSLPHARGVVLNTIQEVKLDIFEYPVIVKPVMNSGSRGVLKCEKKVDLITIIEKTLEYCKDGRFIIEEFIEGDEISVEAIVYENIVEIIQITDKIVTAPPYNVELGHIQPSKYLSLKNDICILIQKVINLSGLNNCAIHPELKIYNGVLTIIEIGPRLGGDYITSHLVPLSSGVNIEELVIKIATEQKFEIERKEMYSMISYLNFPENSLIKDSLSEIELKQQFPSLICYYCSLNMGDKVNAITNSLNRYGHYIIQTTDKNTLFKLKDIVDDFIIRHLVG